MVRVRLVALATLVLTGCTFMVAGEDNFRKVAARRTGIVEKPLEQIYRCFVARGFNPGYQQLYPEAGTAIWSFTQGVTYGAMVDFSRIAPSRTEVTVLGLKEGDWNLYPENIWESRVTPCM